MSAGKRRERNEPSLLLRAGLGLAFGMIFATFLSVAAALFTLGCDESSENCVRWSMGTIFGAYYSGGIVGGIGSGLASALGNSWPARCVGGVALTLPLSFAIVISMYGSPLAWSPSLWKTTFAIGVILGVAIGLTTTKSFMSDLPLSS